MTYWLIIFGVIVLVQFAWHLAREYDRRVRKHQWLDASIQAREILTRELIGRIVALEDKRDRNQIGTREYEALDLEAYGARRALADLVNGNLREDVN